MGPVPDEVAARAGHIAALADHDMPRDLVVAAADAGVPLLPGPGDLQAECDCPEWLHPCRHAAALCYQAAWLLDADPFILLLMRGRGEREIVADLQRRQVTAIPPGAVGHRHGADTQPGGIQPGGIQPGGIQPGGIQPGGIQPGGIQPGGEVPDGIQPGGGVPAEQAYAAAPVTLPDLGVTHPDSDPPGTGPFPAPARTSGPIRTRGRDRAGGPSDPAIVLPAVPGVRPDALHRLTDWARP